MTAVDVDALDKLREAATAGEWSNNSHPWRVDGSDWVIARTSGSADAALIVAAVNSLPDLLAEVRRGRALRERLEGLAEEDDAIRDDYGYRIRNGLDPSPGDRIRAVLAAVDPS